MQTIQLQIEGEIKSNENYPQDGTTPKHQKKVVPRLTPEAPHKEEFQ